MKIKLAKKFTNKILEFHFEKAVKFSLPLFLFFMIVFGCQPRAEKLYKQAYVKIAENRYLEAVDDLESSAELEKNIQKKTKALFEAARILRFEIQDYNKALAHLKRIVLESPDEKIRLLSQQSIAEIYFDHIQDYSMALKEFLVLEPLIFEDQKKEELRLKIAQCYRLTGSNKIALEYIESLLSQTKYLKKNFMLLKAQILQAEEKYDEALLVYEELQKNEIQFFKEEKIYVALSMTLEEKQDYKKAIEYLEKNKNLFDDASFYELRIKRLKEKQINKPFSKGMRK